MRLKVNVTPRSRRDEIVARRDDGSLHIRIVAAPEAGRANEAVIRLLCEALSLPRHAVRVKSGASSRQKWLELDGINEAELRERLGI